MSDTQLGLIVLGVVALFVVFGFLGCVALGVRRASIEAKKGDAEFSMNAEDRR